MRRLLQAVRTSPQAGVQSGPHVTDETFTVIDRADTEIDLGRDSTVMDRLPVMDRRPAIKLRPRPASDPPLSREAPPDRTRWLKVAAIGAFLIIAVLLVYLVSK
jgi:hypothetical protein